MWGNKCDLSISAGAQVYNQLNESTQLKSLLTHIISNDTQQLWAHLQQLKSKTSSRNEKIRIDFILDNAGFELFTDLCLAEFLLSKKFCDVIHFHVKNMPWFVSDTSKYDFELTVKQCMESSYVELQSLGKRWRNRLDNKTFGIVESEYWTLPNDYADMRVSDNTLYTTLGKSNLLFFKGDLNYRKLIGDRDWPHTTSFKEALHGFCPSPLCTLRTLKADLVVGLSDHKAEELQRENPQWMVTGEYAVIQFCSQL